MDQLPVTEEFEAPDISTAMELYERAHIDPATLGWPPFLPIELAMREQRPGEICKAYDISRERFATLAAMPAFQKAFANAEEMLQKEGMSFRIKARMQSEKLLEAAWKLIHAPHTPANVKADLIKATWKVAGFEPKPDTAGAATALQINIHL